MYNVPIDYIEFQGAFLVEIYQSNNIILLIIIHTERQIQLVTLNSKN